MGGEDIFCFGAVLVLLFSFRNGCGELGLGNTSYHKEPQVNPFFNDKKVLQLFVSNTDCAARCAEGNFAWGRNYGTSPVALTGEPVDKLGNPVRG